MLKVYIWRETDGNVGHAALEAKTSNSYTYLSLHPLDSRPKLTNYFREIFFGVPSEFSTYSDDEHSRLEAGLPSAEVFVVTKLDERKVEEKCKEIIQNNDQYHAIKNNCCTVVVKALLNGFIEEPYNYYHFNLSEIIWAPLALDPFVSDLILLEDYFTDEIIQRLLPISDESLFRRINRDRYERGFDKFPESMPQAAEDAAEKIIMQIVDIVEEGIVRQTLQPRFFCDLMISGPYEFFRNDRVEEALHRVSLYSRRLNEEEKTAVHNAYIYYKKNRKQIEAVYENAPIIHRIIEQWLQSNSYGGWKSNIDEYLESAGPKEVNDVFFHLYRLAYNHFIGGAIRVGEFPKMFNYIARKIHNDDEYYYYMELCETKAAQQYELTQHEYQFGINLMLSQLVRR